MSIPATMTAIVIDGKGGPDVLKPVEMPVPSVGPGQVLIKVGAAGINRPDIMQRQGLYPAPKGHSPLPGLEVSGSIADVADDVSEFTLGQPVMALLNGGGYAEYAVAEAGTVLHTPGGLSPVVAAAIPETFFTVWHNVFERGALKPGEWFLVHGGTSGIGVTAIQLATAFGAYVIATAGSPEKCDACRSLGAKRAVDYHKEDFVEAVKDATSGRGVDVILDMVGGDYIGRNLKILAEDGRLVNIAYQRGSSAEIDFMKVMLKRQTITGSTLRARTKEVKAAIGREVARCTLPLLAGGQVKVPIDSTFALRDASAAHARMETSAHIGKIVLTVS